MNPDPGAARRFFVIGDPALNRVALFRDAALAAGCDVQVASYTEVLAEPDAWTSRFAGHTVRLESPGRDFEIERTFLARGAAAMSSAPGHFSRWSVDAIGALSRDTGLIYASRQWYLGWSDALATIAKIAADAGAVFLNDPGEIAVMFDKVACHQNLASRGVPVPPALPPPKSFEELLEAMRAASMHRVFLKPAHGSGASGTVALEIGRSSLRATTALELGRRLDAPALYATRRMRTITDGSEIRSLVDLLCREYLHVEKWIPKIGFAGRIADARVVVIDGIAGPAILRLAHGPITNLHLGASKGSVDQLAEIDGGRVLERVAEVAERAMACFPSSFYGGVDLLISSGSHRVLVAEVNAFGDLIEDTYWHGADAYAWELQAWLRKQAVPRCAPAGAGSHLRADDQVSATGR